MKNKPVAIPQGLARVSGYIVRYNPTGVRNLLKQEGFFIGNSPKELYEGLTTYVKHSGDAGANDLATLHPDYQFMQVSLEALEETFISESNYYGAEESNFNSAGVNSPLAGLAHIVVYRKDALLQLLRKHLQPVDANTPDEILVDTVLNLVKQGRESFKAELQWLLPANSGFESDFIGEIVKAAGEIGGATATAIGSSQVAKNQTKQSKETTEQARQTTAQAALASRASILSSIADLKKTQVQSSVQTPAWIWVAGGMGALILIVLLTLIIIKSRK